MPRKTFLLTMPKGFHTATAIIAPHRIETKNGAMTAPAASTTPRTKMEAITGPALFLRLKRDIEDSFSVYGRIIAWQA